MPIWLPFFSRLLLIPLKEQSGAPTVSTKRVHTTIHQLDDKKRIENQFSPTRHTRTALISAGPEKKNTRSITNLAKTVTVTLSIHQPKNYKTGRKRVERILCREQRQMLCVNNNIRTPLTTLITIQCMWLNKHCVMRCHCRTISMRFSIKFVLIAVELFFVY